MTREAQTGPAAIPNGQLGERFPSGLRVRGRYRVVSEIGAGAFGTVCAGEDESTGHRVAIRFLPRSFANAPQAAQAVIRMGRSIVSASTSHPAMARVLEFGELDKGRPFSVTEFVEGRRLSALRVALELGGAIETLHNMGFIHGAIYPRNVMVLEDGHVKLLDVELAGIRDAREIQGLVNVDPQAEYLSPEQIQKGPVTEKTDIYAYGIVLYELLSGTPPFQGSTRDAIFAKHLKDAPIPIHRRRDGVPASVSRAVSLALYKQPEPRPLMGDILNLLWTGAHGPAPRRKRAAVIVGGSALATLALVAVIWGALALRPPGSPSSTPPTVRELVPPTQPPSAEPRKPGTPLIDTGRAPVGESLTPSVRAPETSVPPPIRSAPTVSTPPVERAPQPARPPVAVAPPAAAPAESRPTPTARQVTPPPTPAVSSPAPTTPPPVAPPAPAVAPPPRPAPTPPAAAVAPPARPAPTPSAQAETTPAVPRSERREPTPAQAPPAAAAPQRPAPSTDSDDSRAVIDWLLKPRSQ